jgi:hypothetical protein
MAMYRRILAVVSMVLLVAGVGGFFLLKASAVGPATDLDRAEVTGYATSTVLGRTSGAVSVELDGESAARIDTIVEGLPRANPRYLCAENQQEYRIDFSAFSVRHRGGGFRTGFELTGYWCDNLVVEVPWHGPAVDRIDRACALLAAVRELLPASAVTTHRWTCERAAGRLFLAESRHPTGTHHGPLRVTGTHKPAKRAPAHKAPAGQAPTPKVPTHKAPVRRAPVRRAPVRLAPVRNAPVRAAPVHAAHGRKAPAHKVVRHQPRPAPKRVRV